MSRLHLDHPSSLFSVELVTSATWPAKIAEDPIGAFNGHLEQAWQAADATAHTARPPAPDPRTGTHDRTSAPRDSSAAQSDGASREAQPGAMHGDPAAASEPQAVGGQKTGAPESQTDAGGETDASQARSDAGQQPGVGQTPSHAGQGTVDSEGEPIPGEKRGREEGEKRGREENASEAGAARGAGGRLLPGGSEQSGRTDAEIITDEDPADSAQAKTADQTPKPKGPKDQLPEQLGQTMEPGNESGDRPADGAADGAAAGGSQPSGPPAQEERPALDVRQQSQRQRARDRVGETAGDPPLAEQAHKAEPALTEQKPSTDPNAGSPGGVKAEVAQPATNTASPADGEGDTGALARAAPNQGSPETAATRPQEPSAPHQAERVRFVQRVARACEAVGERGGTVRLRLHPPELGSLRLEVTVRNGTMNARLEVETTGARNMLLDHLPALRERLAEQEIRVGRFDVDLTGRSPGGSAERPGDHPQPQDRPDHNLPGKSAEQEAKTEGSPAPRAVARLGEGNQLDVII